MTDEKNKMGTITIDASIALYTNDQSISADALKKAGQEYKNNIETAWSGTVVKDGITYTVTTTVTVNVYGSEGAAEKSGAQNVIGVVPSGSDTFIKPAAIFGGPDRGQMEIDGGKRGLAAHEFTHLLGVDDRYSGAYLSNTYEQQRSPDTKATASDYNWAFGGAVTSHRAESRQYKGNADSLETRSSPMFRLGPPENHRSTTEFRAARIWWH